jgi:ribosomal protein S14
MDMIHSIPPGQNPLAPFRSLASTPFLERTPVELLAIGKNLSDNEPSRGRTRCQRFESKPTRFLGMSRVQAREISP